ncbi:UNVERIFIED_CONTAM: hypothetical protein GTU68_036339, partial [Idotea baltica]|nr:hypothetical protein [Idotea baltica]
MELPEIGKNCGVETCQMLDFLPIKCEFCLQFFCKNHNLTDLHNCPKKPIKQIKEKETSLPTKYLCSHADCKNGELTPVICSHCSKQFCLKHRHQIDHGCSEYTPPSNPMAEAASKIEELTKRLSSEPKPAKRVKNEKLAAKVQLMKLKGKAIGSKEVPVEERLFFSLHFPEKLSRGNAPLAVFVSHYWTVGRAIDATADLAKVNNRNNENTCIRLSLFRA